MALHLWLTATLPNLLIYSSIGYKINYHYYKTMNMQWNDNKTISSKNQEKLVKRKKNYGQWNDNKTISSKIEKNEWKGHRECSLAVT